MKTLAMMLAAVVALLAAPPAGAQGLPAAKPEDVGLSSEKLGRIGQTRGPTSSAAVSPARS